MSRFDKPATPQCWKCDSKNIATRMPGKYFRTCRDCGAEWTELFGNNSYSDAEKRIGKIRHRKTLDELNGDVDRDANHHE